MIGRNLFKIIYFTFRRLFDCTSVSFEFEVWLEKDFSFFFFEVSFSLLLGVCFISVMEFNVPQLC